MVLFFLVAVMLWQEGARAEEDTPCADTLVLPRQDGNRIPPIPFTYENVRDYIFSRLQYPQQAVEEGIEGTVLIRFTLMTDGSIDSIGVVTPVHPLLDAEAERLIREMPRWRPVYLHGQPVALSYRVPVVFELLPPETKQEGER